MRSSARQSSSRPSHTRPASGYRHLERQLAGKEQSCTAGSAEAQLGHDRQIQRGGQVHAQHKPTVIKADHRRCSLAPTTHRYPQSCCSRRWAACMMSSCQTLPRRTESTSTPSTRRWKATSTCSTSLGSTTADETGSGSSASSSAARATPRPRSSSSNPVAACHSTTSSPTVSRCRSRVAPG